MTPVQLEPSAQDPCTSTTVGLAPWDPPPVLTASAADEGADRAVGWATATGAAATRPNTEARPASRAMIGVRRRRTAGALTAHLLEGADPHAKLAVLGHFWWHDEDG